MGRNGGISLEDFILCILGRLLISAGCEPDGLRELCMSLSILPSFLRFLRK